MSKIPLLTDLFNDPKNTSHQSEQSLVRLCFTEFTQGMGHAKRAAGQAADPYHSPLSALAVIGRSNAGITFEKFAEEELVTEVKAVGHLGNRQRRIP